MICGLSSSGAITDSRGASSYRRIWLSVVAYPSVSESSTYISPATVGEAMAGPPARTSTSMPVSSPATTRLPDTAFLSVSIS
jgi:hypothetical protein